MTALDIIQAHYAASDRGDLDAMIEPLSEAVEWTEMAGFPYAGTYFGPSEVVANVFERIAKEWDGYRAAVESFVAEGDQVVAFGVYSGTYRATGRFMRARFVHHWRLDQARVVRFEQYTDTALVQAAIQPAG
ncbi:MAG: nuclear transport factor 2 family protein [Actinomycetota bacterium]|nr:nuclear transport factor 2 family protein [Actinomycetota bacterium]